MADEIEVELFFNPSEPKIFGVFKDEIHVRADLMEKGKEESMEPCVLIVSKEEYLRVLDLWITKKREICKRVDKYFGTGGWVYPKNFNYEGTVEIEEWDPEISQKVKKKVPLFDVESFDDEVDMDLY